MRYVVLAASLCIAACATPTPVAPVPAASPVPPLASHLLSDARKAQDDAGRYVADSIGIPARDLIKVLERGQKLRRAVHDMLAHRTTANIARVRDAIRDLRDAVK